MEVVEATCNEQAVIIIGHKSKRRHKPKNKRSGNSIKAADLQNIVHAVENAVYTHDQYGCNAAYQRHIKVVQAFTIMHNGKRVDLDRGNLQHHRYVCKLRAAMPGLQMSMRRAVERNKVEVKRAAQHELQEVHESGKKRKWLQRLLGTETEGISVTWCWKKVGEVMEFCMHPPTIMAAITTKMTAVFTHVHDRPGPTAYQMQ
jgi:hypothetical protein